jgi:hypothetical protein
VGGGSVTFHVAPANGLTVFIRDNRTYQQGAVIRTQQRYQPANNEAAMDSLAVLIKQLRYDVDRCIKVPETEAGLLVNTGLPAIANRKGMVIGFDPTTGQLIMTTGGPGGGGGAGPSAMLTRLGYDTAGSPNPGEAATFGPTLGAPTHFASDQRNALDFDTKVFATDPAMVNLGANPRRINVTQDGIYYVEASVEFDEVSEENVIGIMQNGYDSTGSHTGGVPPNDGLEPTTGWFCSQFGFTSLGVSILLETKAVVPAKAGDFFFVEHQSSATYHLYAFSDKGYIHWEPRFSVTKFCDLPVGFVDPLR